jgi:hypothetical protein
MMMMMMMMMMMNAAFWDVIHVALVRTDIREERITSIIRVTRIGELGATLAVTNNENTLLRNTVSIRQMAFFIVTAVKTRNHT